jgi:hypothetical protein
MKPELKETLTGVFVMMIMGATLGIMMGLAI